MKTKKVPELACAENGMVFAVQVTKEMNKKGGEEVLILLQKIRNVMAEFHATFLEK